MSARHFSIQVMMNTLVLSAGRRVELVQAFKTDIEARGLQSKVLATDMRPELSAACQVADMAFRTPRATDDDYVPFLLDLCLTQEIGLVIPTIDTELHVLARSRLDFAARGIQLVVSDESLVNQCRDKRLTASLFSRLGVSTPRIFDRKKLQFPCFAKPYDGSCGVGATVISGPDMLSDATLANEKIMYMELIDNSHTEFTVDAYYSKQGKLRCLVPRERVEVRAGEISKGITRRNHVYEYLTARLSSLEGARGCITLQLFANETTGRFAAIEINPRFGGGFPLSYSAGARYPGWIVDEYLLGKEVPFFDSWEENLLMLRYDAKVLVHGAN